jgi:hypothetical protein
MANDIQAAISGVVVKNGTAVVTSSWTGQYSTLDTYVSNKPSINDIQDKYDNRFDDPRYYQGDQDT